MSLIRICTFCYDPFLFQTYKGSRVVASRGKYNITSCYRAFSSAEAYKAIWMCNNRPSLCKCANYLWRSRRRDFTRYAILVISGCPKDEDESSDFITPRQPTLAGGKKRPQNWLSPRGIPPPSPLSYLLVSRALFSTLNPHNMYTDNKVDRFFLLNPISSILLNVNLDFLLLSTLTVWIV